MIVVFSGYNQRAVVAFLRTLESDNLDYQIIAAGQNDPILLTRYKQKVSYIRKIKQLNIDDITTGLQKLHQDEVNLIVPSTEALNRFLLKNRARFKNLGFTIPLVSEQLYEQISDKDKFIKLCQQHNIQTPPEHKLTQQFQTPLVAKPKQYISSDGQAYPPIFILSQKDQDEFIQNHNPTDFTYQAYLKGGQCIYLLFYFDKDGSIYSLSQENYLQQPDGKSMICATTSDYHKDSTITRPYIKLFQRVDFRGIVMIELKKLENELYMIEANPRFWGPSQLFCDANYNFFELMLRDYGILKTQPNLSPTKAYYYWSGGLPNNLSQIIYHGNGAKIYQKDQVKFEQADIYRREDTIEIYNAEQLKKLYANTSKHSNYQILPNCLCGLIGEDEIQVKSRYEQERLDYVQKYVDLQQKEILDVGGNTGFFTFESAAAGASHVDYYEGNKVHANFVKLASQIAKLSSKISVFPEYYLFNQSAKNYDIIFNLNVLHHMGDDFDSGKTKKQAKKDIINNLNNMASAANIMILQLGFNWKGNPKNCLFKNGTKQELIEYIKNGTQNYWEIQQIGIAVKKQDHVLYEDLNSANIKRQDELGEFLNRPLFIMKSLKRGKHG